MPLGVNQLHEQDIIGYVHILFDLSFEAKVAKVIGDLK